MRGHFLVSLRMIQREVHGAETRDDLKSLDCLHPLRVEALRLLRGRLRLSFTPK